MSFRTVNKLIATEPFKKQTSEKVVKSGIAMLDKKVSLQKLKIVAEQEPPDPRFPVDGYILVRGDTAAQPWATTVYADDSGVEFILVPEAAVQGVA